MSTVPSPILNFRGGGRMVILILICKMHPSSSLTAIPQLTHRLSDHSSIYIFTKEFDENDEDTGVGSQKKTSKMARQERKKRVCGAGGPGSACASACQLTRCGHPQGTTHPPRGTLEKTRVQGEGAGCGTCVGP